MRKPFEFGHLPVLVTALMLANNAGAEPPAPVPARQWITAPSKPNGSGIRLQYSVDATPSPNQAIPVILVFAGLQEPGATVELQAESGLAVSTSAMAWTLPLGESSWPVTVTPGAQGTFYLNVFTRQRGASSATSIPIQVGPVKALPSAANLKELPSREKLILMPAK
ncbi:hypothetical protein [uncultured Pseudacidovorax sp.]|uniref:hypothetical protein n=1 Tax=uncultured Pseudacidovorax sp. TaxID=679313 RepID=UPI0025D68583|nr:hypothetical protein [uncultured Pseudacidovorax sp.]